MKALPSLNKILKEEGLICHAFSPDGRICAVSLKKSHSIEIYSLDPSTVRNVNSWKYVCQLNEHQQTVSCLAFSVKNHLLSISHDKSIFVWAEDSAKNWCKEQVRCENKLALLKCTWSPNGKKFAVAGGDRKVFIGYFDTGNKWWSTISLQSLSSSITSLSFHPSSKALFIGSADFSAQIVAVNLLENFNEQQKGLKTQSQITSHQEDFKDQLTLEDDAFNGKFKEFDTYNQALIAAAKNATGGWIEACAFTPDGLTLTFAVHNSTLFNITINENGHCTFNSTPLYLKGLPVCSMIYKDNKTLICGTYEGKIIQIQNNGETLSLEKVLDSSSQSAFQVAKNKVGSATQVWEKRQLAVNQEDSKTGHTNPVICLQKYPQEKQFTLSSNDINGNIFFWDI